MEPPSLRCPAALALGWGATLERDGFRVALDDDGLSGTAATGSHSARLGIIRTNGEYVLWPPEFRDRATLLRLERIFLASGAAYRQPGQMEYRTRLLYRLPAPPLPPLETLAERGVQVRVAQRPAFASSRGLASEPHLQGVLDRDRHRVEVETGPAVDQDGTAAYFVELRPKFRFRPPAGLVGLVRDADAALRGAGGVVVFAMKLPDVRPTGGEP